MATRVYKYGLRRPTHNAEVVREQMRGGHVYRNRLIEIERERRRRVREAQSSHGALAALEQDVRLAKEAVDAWRTTIAKHRSEERTLKTQDPARHGIKAAREILRAARMKLSEARRTARDDAALQAATAAADQWAKDAVKEARATCGVYWGTYLLSEAAADAARKTPLYDGIEPRDPHFLRWEGEGQIGVQIQGGIPVADVFTPDQTVIRIDPVDPGTFHAPTRAERRHKSRTHVHLRVGSEGRAPVWATFPLELHRPLPENGRLKRASVKLERSGPCERWYLLVTVELPEGWTEGRCGDGGTVAVDLGWRRFGDDMRVGTWRGEDGQRGECRWDDFGAQKAHELRSVRDRSMNEMAATMSDWVAAMRDVMPDVLREATKHMSAWRSPNRWARLARIWREHRFVGDAEGFERLESWRYHDWHLWKWEACQRERYLNRRKNYYRQIAAHLATNYSTLVLENFDIRPVAKKVAIEDQTENADSENFDNPHARSQRFHVSPSELRSVLVNAFQRRGGRVVYVECANTTRTCHACGHTEAFDAAANVMRTCPACGVTWDQDDNAAENLLRRWRERPGDALPSLTARKSGKLATDNKKSGPKWKRVKTLAAEKRAVG